MVRGMIGCALGESIVRCIGVRLFVYSQAGCWMAYKRNG